MRIGIDISKAGDRDGIGRYTYYLVKTLMDTDPVNQYHLYSLLYPDAYSRLLKVFEGHGDNFVIHPEKGPKSDDVDMFHSTTYSIPLRYSGKIVFTIHDLTFITHPQYHTLTNKIHCMKGTIKAACYADKIIAVSNYTKHDAMEYLGFQEERIEVIYHSADQRFKPVRSVENQKYLADKFGINGSYIFNVGTIEPRKNIKRLIQAYSMLPGPVREKNLLVIAGGGGWLNSGIHTLAKEMGLEDRVKFIGYVDDQNLPVLYSCSEVFVYPSLYEGFGLPVLEAMACGVPVITSKVSSLPEVAGDAAVLIDPYNITSIRDVIIEVLTNKEKSMELCEKGLKRASLFSWKNAAQQTLLLYGDVAKSLK